ncbi:M56 family metallopeptidase [Pedobacter sp. GR22-6]|uniref:M56 family metallopeptidase n=1 Tax=Pedobacter sp. GR22-6 TaxID=3127957 RepID=UPI00307E59CD
MEQLALYLLKSTLCLAVFIALYLVFFKRETFYRFNRYFLLAGLACAIALPFYTYTYQVSVPGLSESMDFPVAAAEIKPGATRWADFALSAYLLVSVIFLLSKVMALAKLKRSIDALGHVELNGYKLVRTNLFKTSFSVFNYIIIHHSPDNTKLEQDLILAHEEAHVRQYHWFDLLVAQVFCSLQWFNPLAWFYQRLIKENHEFLADAAVLEQGNSAAVYRATLINHALGLPVFALASSFSHLDKMSRIKMMMRPKSSAFRKLAALAALPGLLFLVWFFAKPEYVLAQPLVKMVPVAEAFTASRSKPDTLTEQKMKAGAKPKAQKVAKVKVKKPVLIAPRQELQVPTAAPALAVLDSSSIQRQPQTIFENATPQPLYLLDGVPVLSINAIATDKIEAIHVFKGQSAIEKYGESGKNGVVLILSKKSSALKAQQ